MKLLSTGPHIDIIDIIYRNAIGFFGADSHIPKYQPTLIMGQLDNLNSLLET